MADTASGPEGPESEAGPKSGAGPGDKVSPGDGAGAEDESRRKFREARANDQAYDARARAELWDRSLQLTGQTEPA